MPSTCTMPSAEEMTTPPSAEVCSGLVILDAGLEGGQRGFASHHLVQLVAAGVVEYPVAHLQHIAGEQALVHRDIQDDLSGIIELLDLSLDAGDVLFAGADVRRADRP